LKRLGEGEKESLQQTVIAKYEVLASIYQNMYQDRGTSGHPDSEMPLYLKMLLPVYDGWCFSPEWEAPRPVEHWSGRFRNQQGALVDTLGEQHRDQLQAIESIILRRASDYRLLLYGKHLLRRAVDRVARELVTDMRPRRSANPHASDELHSLEELRMLLSTARTNDADGGGTGAWLQTELARLRYVWLISWGELVSTEALGLRGRVGSHSRHYRVERAIRAEDIDQAYDIIGTALAADGGRQTEALGRWYLSILRLCGATKADEERMWRRNTTSTLRRTPRTLTPDRVWGRIALRRLKNHVDYKEKLLQSFG